jgi:uncharacterized membrane protein
MKKRILWIGLATLALAIIVHLAVIQIVPYLIMNSFMAKIPANTLIKSGKPIARPNEIVGTNPDNIGSACHYKLDGGPILYTAQAPADTYWSVSLYAANTDNFFVINDRQIKSNPFSLLIVKEGMKYDNPTNAQVVTSPSNEGILLVRQFVTSDDEYENARNIQKQSSIKVLEGR